MNEAIVLQGAFAGTTSRPQFNQLQPGDYTGRLSRYEWLDSFTQFSGEEKQDLPKWSNPVQQVAAVLTSSKPGEGAITVRLSAEGYYHVSDLSDEEIQEGKFRTADGKKIPFEESEGFIIVKNKAGKWVRIPSEKNTQACKNIINQFTGAAGVPEGTSIPDALDMMVKDGLQFGFTVVNKPHQGKDQFRVSKYHAVKKLVSETESLD